MELDFDPTEVLSKALMAHLATSSPDGPRDSPVWFLWEKGRIWLAGSSRDSFPKRLRLEPRCAVGVVEFDIERGILRHVGIRGTADIQEMNADRLHRMLNRYLGDDKTKWNAWFNRNIVESLDLMIEITSNSVVTKDVSYFRTGPEKASQS